MDVVDAIKNSYKEDSIPNEVTIQFPELDITVGNEQIYDDSLSLEEAVLEKDNIEFVGCIASCFKIQVHGLDCDIKGEKIRISINSGETGEVDLFSGIVDSAIMQTDEQYKNITAYDELYTKGEIDVAPWYNSLSFPTTIGDFRNSLFEYIGLEQVVVTLPNDSISIDKKYDPKTLKALNVIKAICQINGVFGIINRSGLFEYRTVQQETNVAPFPAISLFPTTELFPGVKSSSTGQEVEVEYTGSYEAVQYEEYLVKPVDRLTIRQSDNDAGISVGSGINNYIIQGNMFTYELDENTLMTVAQNIYNNVQGFSYHPFKALNTGLPYMEVGSPVAYYTEDGTMVFYIFHRELKGIQNIIDTFSANGEEYQTEFITDLQTQIDVIKQDVKQEVDKAIQEHDFTEQFGDYTYSSEQIDEKLKGVSGEQWNHVLVDVVPETLAPMTIYYVKGEVVVN